MKCSPSCEATAAYLDLESSNLLADTINATLVESINSDNFTRTLQKNAAECASACTDLASATVEDLPTVEAGELLNRQHQVQAGRTTYHLLSLVVLAQVWEVV